MNKKILLSLITLVIIMGLAGLTQASANPLWAPPPDTPTPMAQSSDPLLYQEDLSSNPSPTETPKSREEQEAIELLQQDQLEQSQALGNEQGSMLPTRVGQRPKNEIATYRDPNFGFSFTYPANWQVDAPAKKSRGKIPDYGYLVTIFNFNNVVAKRDLNPDEIKIDLWLFPKPEDYSTLEAWATTRALFAPETTYSELERFSVGIKRFITWTATGPTVPQGASLYALEQPTFIYLIVGYPSTALYILSLDELVRSLK
jgi:hypothetical protein